MKSKEKTDISFSIIIPVYNEENTIEKCINSIISQNINNYEIIIVNDGSNDKTHNICQKLANSHDKITYIVCEHKGQYSARYHGLKIATKNFVCFVDADDTLADNYFATISEILLKYSNLDLIIINHYEIHENSVWKRNIEFANRPDILLNGYIDEDSMHKFILPNIFDVNNIKLTSGQFIYKHSIIKSSYIKNENIQWGDDTTVIVLSLLKSKSIYIENEPLYCYTRNWKKSSSLNGEYSLKNLCTFYNHIFNNAGKIDYYIYEQLYCSFINDLWRCGDYILTKQKIKSIRKFSQYWRKYNKNQIYLYFSDVNLNKDSKLTNKILSYLFKHKKSYLIGVFFKINCFLSRKKNP